MSEPNSELNAQGRESPHVVVVKDDETLSVDDQKSNSEHGVQYSQQNISTSEINSKIIGDNVNLSGLDEGVVRSKIDILDVLCDMQLTYRDKFRRIGEHIKSCKLSNSEVINCVLYLLVGGEFDLEQNFTIINTPCILLTVELLDETSNHSLQAEVWSVLVAITRKSLRNIQACVQTGLTSVLLKRIADARKEVGHDVSKPDFDSKSVEFDSISKPSDIVIDLQIEMLGIIMSYDVSVKELKVMLFECCKAKPSTNGLQLVWSNQSKKLIEVLKQMPNRFGPDVFFNFPGLKGSGVQIPPMSRFPYENGFTFSTWFRIDPFNASSIEKERPTLFSFQTSKGVGYSAHFVGSCLVLTVMKGKGKGLQHCINSVEFEVRKWYMLTVVYVYGGRWSKSEIKCYVNGILCGGQSIESAWYVNTTEPFDRCYLGASCDLSSDRSFRGQMSTIYLFREALSGQQIEAIHKLGCDYKSQFRFEGECETLNKANSKTIYQSISYSNTSMQTKLSSSILLMYNAVSTDGQLCLDSSPKHNRSTNNTYFMHSPHALMLNEVQAVTTHSIHSSLNSVGGVQVLFPLLGQMDLPSEFDEGSSSSSGSICSTIISFLFSLMDQSMAVQQQMLSCRGFLVISHLLMNSSSSKSHLTIDLLNIFLKLASHLLSIACGTSNSKLGNNRRSQKMAESLLKQLLDHVLLNPALWIYADGDVQSRLYFHLARDFLPTPSKNVDMDSQKELVKQQKAVTKSIYSSVRRVSTVLQMMHALKYYYWVVNPKLSNIKPKGLVSDRPSVNEIIEIRHQMISFIKELIVLDTTFQYPDHATSSSNDPSAAESAKEDEVQSILNFLGSVEEDENLQDVIEMLMDLVCQFPSSFVPAFDARGGVKIVFKLLDSQNLIIRLQALKLLGIFLTRSTLKRKFDVMSPNNLYTYLTDRLLRNEPTISMATYNVLFEILTESVSPEIMMDKHPEPEKHFRFENPLILKVVANLIMQSGQRRFPHRRKLSKRRSNQSLKSSISMDSNSIHLADSMQNFQTTVTTSNSTLIDVKRQFLHDMTRLCQASRENRRTILQMSVWQEWLISMAYIYPADISQQKITDLVFALFRMLLHHAIKYEFGGWRVWVDTLAICHSKVAFEDFKRQFNAMYAEYYARRAVVPPNTEEISSLHEVDAMGVLDRNSSNSISSEMVPDILMKGPTDVNGVDMDTVLRYKLKQSTFVEKEPEPSIFNPPTTPPPNDASNSIPDDQNESVNDYHKSNDEDTSERLKENAINNEEVEENNDNENDNLTDGIHSKTEHHAKHTENDSEGVEDESGQCDVDDDEKRETAGQSDDEDDGDSLDDDADSFILDNQQKSKQEDDVMENEPSNSSFREKQDSVSDIQNGSSSLNAANGQLQFSPGPVRPAFRIPEFTWSSVHRRLLSDLISSLESDVHEWRNDKMKRPLIEIVNNGSENGVLVVNTIHLISQMADNLILACGGLLPLLAAATSPSNGGDVLEPLQGMRPETAIMFLKRIVGLADIIVFASNINFSELESEKSMASGGILRQCLRLVCTSAVISCLERRDHILNGLANFSSSDNLINDKEDDLLHSLSNDELLQDMDISRLRAVIYRDMDETKQAQFLSLAIVYFLSVLMVSKYRDILEPQPASIRRGLSYHQKLRYNSGTLVDDHDIPVMRNGSRLSEEHAEIEQHSIESKDGEESDSRESKELTNGIIVNGDDEIEQTSTGISYLSVTDDKKSKDIENSTINDESYETDLNKNGSDFVDVEVSDDNVSDSTTLAEDDSVITRNEPRSVSKEENVENKEFIKSDGVNGGSSSVESSDSFVTATNDDPMASSNVKLVDKHRNSDDHSLTQKVERAVGSTCPLLRMIMVDFSSFLSKTLLRSHGSDALIGPKAIATFKKSTCVVELVMLLCSQEWQNSLQKHAGLAFIELINEGRLLSHAMKDHIVRVANEAEFILNRMRADDVTKHGQFATSCEMARCERIDEERMCDHLISAARKRDVSVAKRLMATQNANDFNNSFIRGASESRDLTHFVYYKLDSWEDDYRRRRRFIRNPCGTSHHDAILNCTCTCSAATSLNKGGGASLDSSPTAAFCTCCTSSVEAMEVAKAKFHAQLHAHSRSNRLRNIVVPTQRNRIDWSTSSRAGENDMDDDDTDLASMNGTSIMDDSNDDHHHSSWNESMDGYNNKQRGGSRMSVTGDNVVLNNNDTMSQFSEQIREVEGESIGQVLLSTDDAVMIGAGFDLNGTLSLTSSELYFEVDEDHVQYKRMDKQVLKYCDNLHGKWHFSEIRAIFSRRYLLQKNAIEIFLSSRVSLFFTFPTETSMVSRIVKLLPRVGVGIKYGIAQTRRASMMSPKQLFKASNMTERWQKRQISTFEYIMFLNTISGRTYNDLNQYPIFPWVIADYESTELDLSSPSTYRDLSRPIGALNPARRKYFEERYSDWDAQYTASVTHDLGSPTVVPPFHYGTHYSTGVFVTNFLLRIEPFTSMHLSLQSGKFDHPNRLFSSVKATWDSCQRDTADVKELTPEFYYLPEMFVNMNGYHLGSMEVANSSVDTSQSVSESSRKKVDISDVVLPPWADSNPHKFVRINRQALESEFVSCQIHQWIDLVFGFKQRGPEAVRATNVFYYLTYEGSIDFDSIQDTVIKEAVVNQIRSFGQTPSQLLSEPHPPRSSTLHLHPMMFSPPREDICMIVNFISKSPIIHLTANTSSPTHFAPTLNLWSSSYQVLPSSSANFSPAVVSVTASQHFAVNKWNGSTLSSSPNQSNDSSTRNSGPRSVIATSHHSDQHSNLPLTIDPLLSVLSSSSGSSASSNLELSKRHLGDNFSERVSLNHGCFVVTADSKFLMVTGFWDNSFRLFSTENAKLEQVVFGHTSIVNCICRSEVNVYYDCFIATGSADCTVRLWRWSGKYHCITGDSSSSSSGNLDWIGGSTDHSSSSFVAPCCILTGHDTSVCFVVMSAELGLVLSASQDGLILIHTTQGELNRKIEPPFVQQSSDVSTSTSYLNTSSLISDMVLSREGWLVVSYENGKHIKSMTVNGDLLSERRFDCVDHDLSVSCMVMSKDGEYVILALSNRSVEVWRTFDFDSDSNCYVGKKGTSSKKALYQYPPCDSPIKSMALTFDQKYLLVGLSTGAIVVFHMDFNRWHHEFQNRY